MLQQTEEIVSAPASTNKKQRISEAAEALFATRGYGRTSTQLIAREAGVSEALIYKHFGSKDELLEDLIKAGYRRIVEHNSDMLNYAGPPLDFVFGLLDLPTKLVTEEPGFWGMQYRLVDLPLSLQEHQRFLMPVHELLVQSFRELGYGSPVGETELLLLIIDALWKHEVLLGIGSTKSLGDLIKQKYTRMTM